VHLVRATDLGSTVNDQISALKISGNTPETRLLYLRGADWCKVTVTLLPPKASVPVNAEVQIVEYASGNPNLAKLTIDKEDSWYKLMAT
jgi:hypothetical protein